MLKKLPPDFKAKWVAALRSGEYKQATSYLRCDDGFCCLGVACDLHNPNTWQEYNEFAFRTDTHNISMPGAGDLPDPVFDVIFQPYMGSKLVMDHLMCMNDTNQYSFAEIAKWIEEKL